VLPPNVTALILGIIDPKIYAIPYVILIIILAIFALASFMKFPSLRNYHRKRNVVVYSATLLIFALMVFQAYDASSVALVGYRVESHFRFDLEAAKNIGVTCSSRNAKSCNFYLVLKSVNASFPTLTELNYLHISDRAVKVPFTISGLFSPTEVTKYVFFEIDKNVTGFSFSILPDSWSSKCLFVSGQPSVSYVWNGTENCFMLHESGIWVA
jgi:hypothetical protein